MLYLLDTNVCIRFLNGTSAPVKQRLEATRRNDIAVCSVVKAELFYGAMRSRNPSKTLIRYREFLEPFVSLPFDDEAAIAYGQIRADLAEHLLALMTYKLPLLPSPRALPSSHTTPENLVASRVCRLKIGRWRGE